MRRTAAPPSAGVPVTQMDRFEEAKLRVKQAVDLVEFVLGYIPLTRRGRYMVALCPFRPDTALNAARELIQKTG